MVTRESSKACCFFRFLKLVTLALLFTLPLWSVFLGQAEGAEEPEIRDKWVEYSDGSKDHVIYFFYKGASGQVGRGEVFTEQYNKEGQLTGHERRPLEAGESLPPLVEIPAGQGGVDDGRAPLPPLEEIPTGPPGPPRKVTHKRWHGHVNYEQRCSEDDKDGRHADFTVSAYLTFELEDMLIAISTSMPSIPGIDLSALQQAIPADVEQRMDLGEGYVSALGMEEEAGPPMRSYVLTKGSTLFSVDGTTYNKGRWTVVTAKSSGPESPERGLVSPSFSLLFPEGTKPNAYGVAPYSISVGSNVSYARAIEDKDRRTGQVSRTEEPPSDYSFDFTYEDGRFNPRSNEIKGSRIWQTGPGTHHEDLSLVSGFSDECSVNASWMLTLIESDSP